MALELATLGVEVKTQGLAEAARRLEALEKQSARADAATSRLAGSVDGLAGRYTASARAAREEAEAFRRSEAHKRGQIKLSLDFQRQYAEVMGFSNEAQRLAIEEQRISWEDLANSIDDVGQRQLYLAQINEMVAQQLRMVSGDVLPGLSQGFYQYAEDSLRTFGKVKGIVASLGRGFEDALVSAVDFTGQTKFSFSDMAQSILNDITRLVAQRFVVGPIFGAISGLMGGAGVGGFFADGGVFRSPGLHAYQNQVVTRPTIFPFAQGGALGLMGEAGPEAVMPLSRDRRGRLGVSLSAGSAGGGGGTAAPTVNIQVINQSGAPVTAAKTEESRDSSGNLNLKLIIDQVDQGLAARENRGASRFGNALRGKSGLNPSATLHRGGGA